MELVIIGTGNAAAVMGRKCIAAGHHIAQVVGRNAKAASALAYEWNTVSTNYIGPVNRKADVYLVAVNENAIDDITNELRLPGHIVAHTSAITPKEILRNISEHYGVFYPLKHQTEQVKKDDAAVYIDASDEQTRGMLEKLARSVSSEHSDDAFKLDMAAVFVTDFTNHLYALAEQYCQKEGLDFKQLEPRIQETAARVKAISPQQVHAGPAFRNDEATILRHLALLEGYPELQQFYKLLTESIRHHK